MQHLYRCLLLGVGGLLLALSATAQDEGRFFGNLDVNANYFVRDSSIGAANTPQYDNLLYGAEAWLNLNYSYKGFDVGLRLDIFNNSNLPDPQRAVTGQGIGMWYIKKQIGALGITAGRFYEQIGSGIIMRAYEARPLAIDNSLYGVRGTYDFGENWQIRAFTGRMRLLRESNNDEQPFISTFRPVIKGGAVDGYVPLNDEGTISIAPGFGMTSRTLDDNTIQRVVAQINTYSEEEAFVPKYNTYAFTAYNQLSAGAWTWFVEGAYKTQEALFDPFAERVIEGQPEPVLGRLVNSDGYVVYSSLSYAANGWGITVEGKHTEGFDYRISPLETGIDGLITFVPPMARENAYRLTARYNAATQFLGEDAIQVDIRYAPSRKINYLVNFSNIVDLDQNLLYRELFTQVNFKKGRKWRGSGGVQLQQYNQEVYEGKPGAPLVETIIPYLDVQYKLSRKRTIRGELQYMYTEQDFGSFIFGLAEISIAPHWIFTVSDMVNIVPKNSDEIEHYYTGSIFYTNKANRFSLSYVKQVEGVVCTGGICRFEPAFNGVRFTLDTTF